MHPRTTPRPQACVKRLPRRRTALAAHSPACTACGWREASRWTSREGPAGLRMHPGRDWSTVLSGAVVLRLGERTILVQAGETAQFSRRRRKRPARTTARLRSCAFSATTGARAIRASPRHSPGQAIHVTAMSGARSQLVNKAGRVGGAVRASTGNGMHRTRHDRSCLRPAEAHRAPR
jgi:hypothetical protein